MQSNWKEEFEKRFVQADDWRLNAYSTAGEAEHFIETEVIEKLIADYEVHMGLHSQTTFKQQLRAKWLGKE